MPKIHNKHHRTAPADAIYIGRGSPWGNPFVIGKDGSRSEVIQRFKDEVLPTLDLEPLRGKDLVCFCKPQACHGDAILEALALEQAEPITEFTGDYRWLSNFWVSPVHLDGYVFPSAEHAFQAAKSMDPADWAAFTKPISPGQAKRMGRKIRLRSDWDTFRLQAMAAVLEAKFQDPGLRRKLLATGHAELIEGNTWGDTFWGVCNGKGQNQLGKLLMAERQRIRKE